MKSCSIFLFISCLLTSCSQQANIKYVEDYLPQEVYSRYSVSKFEGGKFYCSRIDDNGITHDYEYHPIGIKVFIEKDNVFDSSYITKESNDKYYLELNDNYRLRTYLVTRDDIRGVDVLHSMLLYGLQDKTIPYTLNTSTSLKSSVYKTDYNTTHVLITPEKLGTAWFELTVGEFKFKQEVKIVSKGSREKIKYQLQFVVDSSFLGTSATSRLFKAGEKITIDTHYSTGVYDEVITFNGQNVTRVNPYVLPSIDLKIEYYHYGYAPEGVPPYSSDD